MAAYEKHFKGKIELGILYLLGLFDYPVSSDIFNILLENRPVNSFHELVFYLKALSVIKLLRKSSKSELKYAIENLNNQQLINIKENIFNTHPLIQEYFNKRLKKQSYEEYKQFHEKLYKHYKEVQKKPKPNSLKELKPLILAVSHGCLADIPQKTLEEVYYTRIMRGATENYVCKKLNAYALDLSILSNFFEDPWDKLLTGLNDNAKNAIYSWTGYRLRELGRVQEALDPMNLALEGAIKAKDWKNSSVQTGELTDAQLMLGNIHLAIQNAEMGVGFALENKEGEIKHYIMSRYTYLAYALHQAGKDTEAHENFQEAEKWQKSFTVTPRLYAFARFKYCIFLLSKGDWKAVIQRATQSITWCERNNKSSILDRTNDKLLLGQAYTQQAFSALKKSKDIAPDVQILQLNIFNIPMNDIAFTQPLLKAKKYLTQSIENFQSTNNAYHLVFTLLTFSRYYRLCINLDKKKYEISKDNQMKLLIVDHHLESPRLILTINPEKQSSLQTTAKEHIKIAKNLIESTGYKKLIKEVTYIESYI